MQLGERELSREHLHLFGGEDLGEEGVREACESKGVAVDWVDIAYASPRDLLDDATYTLLLAKARKGDYDSAWAAFPCKAFCHSRWKEDGGGAAALQLRAREGSTRSRG